MTNLHALFDVTVKHLAQALEKSGKNPTAVKLLAVSKNHEAEKIASIAVYWQQQYANHKVPYQPSFGESYVQEALQKQAEVLALMHNAPQPAWHFIGHIQSRKAKELVGKFDLIHSVSSLKVAQNLHNEWTKQKEDNTEQNTFANLPTQNILVQVNIGEEEQKSGVLPQNLEALCTQIMALPSLALQGFMCIPPVVEKTEEARPYFARLRTLQEAMQTHLGLDLPELSMGMSGDYCEAIEEGATLVRVGTSIFGQR